MLCLAPLNPRNLKRFPAGLGGQVRHGSDPNKTSDSELSEKSQPGIIFRTQPVEPTEETVRLRTVQNRQIRFIFFTTPHARPHGNWNCVRNKKEPARGEPALLLGRTTEER